MPTLNINGQPVEYQIKDGVVYGLNPSGQWQPLVGRMANQYTPTSDGQQDNWGFNGIDQNTPLLGYLDYQNNNTGGQNVLERTDQYQFGWDLPTVDTNVWKYDPQELWTGSGEMDQQYGWYRDENVAASHTDPAMAALLGQEYTPASSQRVYGNPYEGWGYLGAMENNPQGRSIGDQLLSFGKMVAPFALPALGMGFFGPGEAAAAGSASGGGTAAAGSGALGSGLSVGSSASGIGGGALGTGLTAGTTASGMGAGALGTGIGAGAGGAGALVGGGALAGTALAPGFFGAESLYPVMGGLSTPSGLGGVSGGAAATGGSTAAGGLSSLSGLMSNPAMLGMGLGALSGALGGGTKAGTVTVEEGIPDWLMPYVKPQLDKYSTQVQNYQVDPYGIMPEAMKQFQNTVSGQFLDPATNKWLEQYFNLGAERIKGSLSPSFGHMQAFGQHSGYNEALSRGLGDFAVGLYGGAYERERDRMNTMIGDAPAFLNNASTANFAPYTQYLNTVGNLGKKKEQPYFENPFGNIVGGGMLGYGLGKML